MSAVDSFREISPKRQLFLNEGLCPWDGDEMPHSLRVVTVYKDGVAAQYGYCYMLDVYVRTTNGDIDAMTAEEVLEKGWTICPT